MSKKLVEKNKTQPTTESRFIGMTDSERSAVLLTARHNLWEHLKGRCDPVSKFKLRRLYKMLGESNDLNVPLEMLKNMIASCKPGR